MSELRECPFCGQKDEPNSEYSCMRDLDIVDDEHGRVWIACRSCDASGPIKVSERHAVKAWNTRTEPKQTTDCTECADNLKCLCGEPKEGE